MLRHGGSGAILCILLHRVFASVLCHLHLLAQALIVSQVHLVALLWDVILRMGSSTDLTSLAAVLIWRSRRHRHIASPWRS